MLISGVLHRTLQYTRFKQKKRRRIAWSTTTQPMRSYKHRAIEQTERKGRRRSKGESLSKVTFVLLYNSFEIAAAQYKKKTRMKWRTCKKHCYAFVVCIMTMLAHNMRLKCHTLDVKNNSLTTYLKKLKKHKMRMRKQYIFSELFLKNYFSWDIINMPCLVTASHSMRIKLFSQCF